MATRYEQLIKKKKSIKRSSTSFTTSEQKIKTTLRYNHPLDWKKLFVIAKFWVKVWIVHIYIISKYTLSQILITKGKTEAIMGKSTIYDS